MTTAKQGFIDACRELATADPYDRMEFKTVIAAERGLHCSQPDCPRFAMARVYRPTDGPNTRVSAIAALLTGDLVSELRCAACAEAERFHVIDHLCPCGESARYDAILTHEMSREVVSHYPSGLSPNPPNRVVGVAEREIRDMEERLSGRFWTVGAGERLATVMWSSPARDRTSRRRSLAGLGPVWGRSGASFG